MFDLADVARGFCYPTSLPQQEDVFVQAITRRASDQVKIFHVCWDLGQGGIQRYLIDLLVSHKGEFESYLVVLTSPGELSREATSLCEDVFYLGMKNGLSIASLNKLRRLVFETQCDLVHLHCNPFLVCAALAIQRKPIVFTEHGGRLLNDSVGGTLFYQVFGGRVDRFIAISEYIGRMMGKKNPGIKDRVSVIPNGVDFDSVPKSLTVDEKQQLLPQIGQGPRIGYVGRVTLDKGIDLFLETAEIVLRSTPKAKFIVIGDGEERANAEEQVSRKNLGDSIFFLGYRSDARTLFGALDICLFTSRYEGFGLVIVESMAAGVPVVALNENGAAGEIIENGTDGFVIDGLDTAAAAQRVVELIAGQELRQAMSLSGKTRVREVYTMDACAKAVAKEYRSVCEK